MLPPKKFMLSAKTSYWSKKNCVHAPGYYLTFVSFSLFDLSNRRISKKSIFTCCSVLTDFCHYLQLPLNLFLFELFWSEELLKEVATVANVLMDVLLELKMNQKWIYYLAYTNVANENCVKFCMKEVFKCRERRMMWWDEGWTKAQALFYFVCCTILLEYIVGSQHVCFVERYAPFSLLRTL
jgi:hypothetical protein